MRKSREESRIRNAAAQAALRARRRQLGYKQMQIWVHQDDVAEVEAMLNKLRIKRDDF